MQVSLVFTQRVAWQFSALARLWGLGSLLSREGSLIDPTNPVASGVDTHLLGGLLQVGSEEEPLASSTLKRVRDEGYGWQRPLAAKRPKPLRLKECAGCEITTFDPDPVTNGTDWRDSDSEVETAEWAYYTPPFPRDKNGRIMDDIRNLDPMPEPGGCPC